MHDSAIANAKLFFECYVPSFQAKQRPIKIVEIGSQDVNGSLRIVAPPAFEYVGVDFVAAKGVDVVLDDPYVLPFPDNTVDIVISSSSLEHSEMFWLAFLDIMRVLKPDGLFYMNVPSNGAYHRYPVDCWRFYPDSGKALVAWARRNGMNACLFETYTSLQGNDIWNDCVSIFLKDEAYRLEFPRRIVDTFQGYDNGFKDDTPGILRHQDLTEDQRKLGVLGMSFAETVNR